MGLILYLPVSYTHLGLNIPKNRINIKATTEEGLGFTGEKQGIAAHCVCLLEE